MELGFCIYDEDKDGFISKKDLYSPFVIWSKELYEELFVKDLQIMLPNISDDGSKVITDKNALNFKTYSSLFDDKVPAIIEDILLKVIQYRIPDKSITKIDQEAERSKLLLKTALSLIEEKSKADKIIGIFRTLAINTQSLTMHITFDSMLKGFVRFQPN